MPSFYLRIAILFVLLGGYHCAGAQSGSPLGDLFWYPIVNFPAEEMPAGVDSLVMVCDGTEGGLWVGAVQGDGLKMWDDFREETFLFNHAKSYGEARWEEGRIEMKSQMPFRAAVVEYEFKWQEGHFVLTKETYFDPNEAHLEALEVNMAAGDVCGAINAVNALEYPFNAINTDEFFADALVTAHEEGLAAYRKKDHAGAIRHLECVLVDSWASFPEDHAAYAETEAAFHDISKAKFETILGDHGLFLLRAGEYERSVEVNQWLLDLNPELLGPYLQLGDALWATDQADAARTAYQSYTAGMDAAGRSAQIPSRVRDRLTK